MLNGFLSPAPTQSEQMLEEYAVARKKGMSPRAAALHAGWPESKANQAARTIEPKAQKTLRELLPVFAPNQRLAERLAEGLDAMKHLRDGSEVADQRERRETVRLIAELTGELKPERDQAALTITLSGPMVEQWMRARQAASGDGDGATDTIEEVSDDPDNAAAAGVTIDARP